MLTGSQITSAEIQAGVVDFINTTTCDQLLKPSCNRNWCGVTDNQLCAGRLAGGVDACQVNYYHQLTILDLTSTSGPITKLQSTHVRSWARCLDRVKGNWIHGSG